MNRANIERSTKVNLNRPISYFVQVIDGSNT